MERLTNSPPWINLGEYQIIAVCGQWIPAFFWGGGGVGEKGEGVV